jgi:hypothetical protein
VLVGSSLRVDDSALQFETYVFRFHSQGPGQYKTDTVESDWNRPTHNISIATEMELAMMQ